MEKIKNLGISIMEKLNVLIERIKTDKKFCAIFAGITLAVIVAIVAIVAVVGGGSVAGPGGIGGGTTDDGEKVSYTVSIKTQGGLVLSEIDVAVYGDEKHTDLKDYVTTDENGLANFQLGENGEYYIVLSGVPKGYEVEEHYSFDGTTAVITLKSSLVTDDDISTATLGLGDVMYDFTITTPDGDSYTLSELLKEKKMVMLNFWYTPCSWCVTEFPIMAEAYEQYKDEIEILALNPLGEGSAAVKSFQETHALPFPTAECPTSWAQVFGIAGYPTSIIIDQYGVICVVESGAITSLRPFVSAFEHFIAEDYEQKLCVNGVADLVTQIKPNVTMPTSEEIAAVINKGDIEVTYRPETEDDSAEYSWPFVITEKNGEKCIYAPNSGIEDSFAIMYADVTLKKGQALKMDYLSSTEKGNDIMYVIVNDEPIFNISGWTEEQKWESCYPCIAEEDGVYEVALCYIKDSDTNEGDDTVYIKGMSVVDESQIDTATYIPRLAAKETEDGYTYADIVYNETDGYYHVGSKNGPLLLADLMGYTQFNEEKTVYELVYDDGEFEVDGKDCYDAFIQYCNYASNAKITGVCTVTKELAEFLKEAANLYGFEDDENEWLKLCKYYAAYGSNGEQLEDPIKGLATFSAYKATLGKGVSTNFFYYDRAIIPRGLMAEFTPSVSGVYRITSYNDSQDGVDAWIFNENREELLTYERDERLIANYADDNDVSMVYYMEAGKSYYIDIAFWDVYEVGTIKYDIEYIGASADIFRLASPGYFTYDSDATGDAMYYVIAGGIDVVLNPNDGLYYEDLGKDANGNQKYGSKLYADFTGVTAIFNTPIKSMIDKGAFDFSKTEYDNHVIDALALNNNDQEATLKYLKDEWGDDYETYYELYEVEDVLEGKYHGEGEDYTEAVRKYVSQIDARGTEKDGCVVVTEELAEILQFLMDKYTFEDVEQSPSKLKYIFSDLLAK